MWPEPWKVTSCLLGADSCSNHCRGEHGAPGGLMLALDEEHGDVKAGDVPAEVDVLELGVHEGERVDQRGGRADLLREGVLLDEQVRRVRRPGVVVGAVL